MIALARIVLFIIGTLLVIAGTVLILFGGLAVVGGAAVASGVVLGQLLGGLVLLLMGTIGVTKLDRRLKTIRDRRRARSVQEREFT